MMGIAGSGHAIEAFAAPPALCAAARHGGVAHAHPAQPHGGQPQEQAQPWQGQAAQAQGEQAQAWHGQAEHGGGAQIAFGGQHGGGFAAPASHVGAEPLLTACRKAASYGLPQTAL